MNVCTQRNSSFGSLLSTRGPARVEQSTALANDCLYLILLTRLRPMMIQLSRHGRILRTRRGRTSAVQRSQGLFWMGWCPRAVPFRGLLRGGLSSCGSKEPRLTLNIRIHFLFGRQYSWRQDCPYCQNQHCPIKCSKVGGNSYNTIFPLIIIIEDVDEWDEGGHEEKKVSLSEDRVFTETWNVAVAIGNGQCESYIRK